MSFIKKGLFFLKKYLYSGIFCCYLFLGGFLSAKNRPLITYIYDFFNMFPIPKIDLFEIITDEDNPIAVRCINAIDGNISQFEIVVINAIVKYYKPINIFEIGTFNGRTTLNMAANSLKESTIFTLDLPQDMLSDAKLYLHIEEKKYIEKDISGSLFIGKPENDKINQLYGDSANFDFSPYYNKIDLIFIDGSHSYEYVINDSKIAINILKKPGVIIWHDYTMWDGVNKALDELYFKNPLFKNIRRIKGTTMVCLIEDAS